MSDLTKRRIVAGSSSLIGIAWVCVIAYANLMSESPSEKWTTMLLLMLAFMGAIPGIILSYYGIRLWQEARILWCLRIISTGVTLVVFFFASYISVYLEGSLESDRWSIQLETLVALLSIGVLYVLTAKKICAAVGLGQLWANQIIPRWFVGILMFQFAVVLWALGEDFLIKGGGIIEVSAGTRFLVTFGPIFLGVGGFQFLVHKLRIEKNGPHRSFQLTK